MGWSSAQCFNATIVNDIFVVLAILCQEGFQHFFTKTLKAAEGFLQWISITVRWLHIFCHEGDSTVLILFKMFVVCFWTFYVLQLFYAAGYSCSVCPKPILLFKQTELHCKQIQGCQFRNLLVGCSQWQKPNQVANILNISISTATSGSNSIGMWPIIPWRASGSLLCSEAAVKRRYWAQQSTRKAKQLRNYLGLRALLMGFNLNEHLLDKYWLSQFNWGIFEPRLNSWSSSSILERYNEHIVPFCSDLSCWKSRAHN